VSPSATSCRAASSRGVSCTWVTRSASLAAAEGEVAPAGEHRTDARDERVGGNVLENVGLGAGLQRPGDVLVGIVGGEHHHARLWIDLANPPHRLDALHLRHALAPEETETALVTYRQRQLRLVKLTDEVRESARAASIARVRYREGVADFLALLDAERTALQAEDSAAQAEADVFTGIVGLYRAVGGVQ
jgi:Outer membrane efflux protein